MSAARPSGRSRWAIALPAVTQAALLMVALVGCASLQALAPPVEDVSEKRRERSRECAEEFGRHRDVAELEAARVRWDEGNACGCAEILGRILARSPDHFEVRLLLAEALLADNRPSEAITCLEPALADHPTDARAHHLMGSLLDSIGHKAKALVYYEQAMTLQPNDEVYAVCYQALASEEAADGPQQAEVRPQDASGDGLPASPGVPALSEAIPAASADRAEDVEPRRPPTIRILSAEKGTSPRSGGTSPGASRSSRSNASRSDALSPQESPKRLVPDTTDSGRIGDTGSAAGTAYTSDMTDASAAELIEQGLSAMADGTTALAFACFREAMALRPDDPQIPISAATSALGHNQPEVAVALLEPLLEVFADSAAIRRVLGAAYYRLGDYKSSQVVLQQALSLDKSNGLSYFLMGCTLAKLGHRTAAETHFVQARRLDPRYGFRR